MIFKITFKVLDRGALLPLSYQYEFSSWIYHLMAEVDQPFATWLHDQGYNLHGKRFKLFTFSRMSVPRDGYTIRGDRMKINAPYISIRVSFFVEQAAEAMIIGIFQQKRFELGDKKSKVSLLVDKVELLPLEIEQDQAMLRTTSPMVIAKKESNLAPDQYLHPLASDFSPLFWHNIQSKYEHAVIHQLAEPINWDNVKLDLTINSNHQQIKSRLITIKAFTPQQTKVRGFLFDFSLKAPVELIRFGILAGFGAHCSLGFGSVRLLS